MATKNENEKVGIIDPTRQPKKDKELTSVVQKRSKSQDGNAEAGVDPQQEILHEMPNPEDYPKEPKKIRKKK